MIFITPLLILGVIIILLVVAGLCATGRDNKERLLAAEDACECVMRHFAYKPGFGPDYYEKCRLVVERRDSSKE